jgi:hypothetical protein
MTDLILPKEIQCYEKFVKEILDWLGDEPKSDIEFDEKFYKNEIDNKELPYLDDILCVGLKLESIILRGCISLSPRDSYLHLMRYLCQETDLVKRYEDGDRVMYERKIT